ncbi:MAG TPA: SDR family NAD(P)-dependent oxidoreductase [Capsulimonadaceae bacterium]|jgi:NAD(P)-dependent dehydrogenase (short-subunit alcohol dehydrogenase family)
MNPIPLDGKVAFITGAARGIGFGIAKRFAAEGATIVITDVNIELAEKSAQRIADESGRPAMAVFCDVTDRASVDGAVAATVAKYGGVDILVSNAGICPFIEFIGMDNATWQKTIDVILTGSFNVAQACAKVMIAQGKERGGRMIFITSGSTVQANSNQADYAAAKSGERMFMAAIAPAMGRHGITCNALEPGVIYTEMGAFHWDVPEHREEYAKQNPCGRIGMPEDIACGAVFLAGPDGSYVTGTTLRVDGGRLCIG